MSDGVVALLQVLQLQLGHVVLRHAGTLSCDGIQQAAVAQHLLVQQLSSQHNNTGFTSTTGFKRLGFKRGHIIVLVDDQEPMHHTNVIGNHFEILNTASLT